MELAPSLRFIPALTMDMIAGAAAAILGSEGNNIKDWSHTKEEEVEK